MTSRARQSPDSERPSYWPYKDETEKRLIETHIECLLTMEAYERRLWGDAWPPPLPKGYDRWRRQFRRELWGGDPQPGHQFSPPLRSRPARARARPQASQTLQRK